METKKAIVKNGKILRKLQSAIQTGSKIHYVRYADDWIIGVTGPKTLALEIRELVKEFLKKELKLDLNMEKTKITHLGTQYAYFLGHYIKVQTISQHQSYRRTAAGTIKVINPIRKSTGKPQIMVPTNLLQERLIQKGFANPNGRPKCCNKLIFLPDHEIVKRYNSILRGIMNFYNMAENRSSLNEAVYILEYSLAHTIAAKHRSTLAKIFNKYGKPMRVFFKGEIFGFDKPASLSAEYLNKKYYRVKDVQAKNSI